MSVTWQDFDVTRGWAKTQSKNIVTYLRHVAPIWNNRFKKTIPTDRGGWVTVRDLAGALGLSIDDLLSILRAMSRDPKDRCQVSMLYRKRAPPTTQYGRISAWRRCVLAKATVFRGLSRSAWER